MNRILRYEVPVDDRWHTILEHGVVLHVECRRPDVVEFWAWERPGLTLPTEYRVYGTGHTVDSPGSHVGTAVAPGGLLVWHLLRRT